MGEQVRAAEDARPYGVGLGLVWGTSTGGRLPPLRCWFEVGVGNKYGRQIAAPTVTIGVGVGEQVRAVEDVAPTKSQQPWIEIVGDGAFDVPFSGDS